MRWQDVPRQVCTMSRDITQRRQKDLNLRGGFPRLRALQARPFGRSGMPPDGEWIVASAGQLAGRSADLPVGSNPGLPGAKRYVVRRISLLNGSATLCLRPSEVIGRRFVDARDGADYWDC